MRYRCMCTERVAEALSICGSCRFHTEFALAVELGNERRVYLSPVMKNAFLTAPAREAFVEASELPG